MRTPIFRQLTEAECTKLLTGNHVGRLAFSEESRVDIEPIHYVYVDGAVFGRTSDGSKVEALRHRPWVAFEVDEVRSMFDWKSVVVHGTIYFLETDGTTADHQRFERAIDMLRTFMPETLTADDPVPWRGLVFVLHPNEVTGRAAEMKVTRSRLRRDSSPTTKRS